MKINELFNEIQNRFDSDIIKGEFILTDDAIIWSYNLDGEIEEIDIDDDELYGFETESPEELLKLAYDEDYEKLENFLDEIEEFDNWTISDFEIIDNLISFKIY